MPFTPTTAVYLCSVPLEKDQKNQLDFANQAAQHLYFSNNIKKSYTSFTYQRKDSVLRVPAEFDELYDCNYVMYQNSNFGSKWFYCFVDHMEYVNPNCTNIYLKTDVFQTWMFDWTLLRSFVAREHVADDTPWKHTLAEPINKPEYNYNSMYSKVYDSMPGNQNTTWCYCVYATPDNGNDKIRPAIEQQGGGYVEVTNYTIGHMRTSGYLFGAETLADLKDLIETLIQENYSISYTITLPLSHVIEYLAVEWQGTFQTHVYPFFIYGDRGSGGEVDYITLTALTTTTIGTHTVRNKKLNCYPYRFVCLTDDVNQKIELKYELLNPAHDTQHSWSGFAIYKTAGSTPAAILFPTGFAGKLGNDFTNAVTLSSFPPVPYDVDYFQQYLALHKASFAAENLKQTESIAGGLVGSGMQALSGNAIGGGFSAASTLLDYNSYLSKFEDMANHPPAVHNAPSGEPKYYSNSLRFRIYDVYATPEYLDKIDSFFDFYGYNVSIVKVPQFTSRPAWNYIETREINIEGSIPQDDMQELKAMFNRGFTVWHDPAHFCDYSQNNAPTP